MKHPGHSESVDSEIFNVRGKCFGTDIVVVVICILLNINVRENQKDNKETHGNNVKCTMHRRKTKKIPHRKCER